MRGSRCHGSLSTLSGRASIDCVTHMIATGNAAQSDDKFIAIGTNVGAAARGRAAFAAGTAEFSGSLKTFACKTSRANNMIDSRGPAGWWETIRQHDPDVSAVRA